MNMVEGFWIFFSFIFFKVALSLAFQEVSTVCSLLMGVMVGISVYQSRYFYDAEMKKNMSLKAMNGKKSNYFFRAGRIWLLVVLCNILLGKVLAFGFSEILNIHLGGHLFFSFDYLQASMNIQLFSAIMAVPVTVNFIMVLFSVRVRMRIS